MAANANPVAIVGFLVDASPLKNINADELNRLKGMGYTDDAAAIMASLAMDLDYQSIANVADLYSYQGFNIIEIINAIVARGIQKGRTKEQILSDVKRLIILYLSRGTQTGKFEAKSKKEAVPEITGLLAVYDIKPTDKATGASGKGPNIITLSRVANAFAFMTARIAASSKIQIIGRKIDGLAKGYHWAGAPATMAEGQDGEPDYAKWKVWALSFDKAINFGSKQTDEERQANIEKFGDIMRRNTQIGATARKALQTFLNNSESTGVVKAGIAI